MSRLLILGAGTAGTIIANRLRKRLDDDWTITIVEESDEHHYQPGYLFLPFGTYDVDDVVKPTAAQLHDGIDLVMGKVAELDTDAANVRLEDGRSLGYDQLVIATGTHPAPDQTPGLDSDEAGRTIHEFYTLDGALALTEAMRDFDHGRLVMAVIEMPIKCPVAPLEFVFLSDAHFSELGVRNAVDITYVTPLDGAFTKPVAAGRLGHLLADRNVAVETDFMAMEVDPERRVLVSYDEREVPYDLLVTVPVNMGADFVAAAGLGDELNHVIVDRHTFLADGHDNIFAVGDASNIPTSKAGSVAHFASEVFVENFMEHIAGRPMTHRFDGHANCFVESGYGKGMLIDFNYDVEPLPGKYPVPKVGPFSLLTESRLNHWGKMAFKTAYWSLLLPGRPVPVPGKMSMAGKELAASTTETEGASA